MSGLRPGERPAHLVGISPTQRAALIAMHGAMDLVPHRGAWAMPGDIKPAVSRATMICLGRRNLIRVNEFGCSARATLTPLGAWYARTLEQQAIDAQRAEGRVMEMDFWEIFAWAEGLVLLALLIARFWRRT